MVDFAQGELFPQEVVEIHRRELLDQELACAARSASPNCVECGGFGFVLLPSRVPGYEQAWRDAQHVQAANDGLHYLSCKTCKSTTL